MRATKTTLLTVSVLGLGFIVMCRASSGDAIIQSMRQREIPAATPVPPVPSKPPNITRTREEIGIVESLISGSQRSGFVDHGAALYFLAGHYLKLGDRSKALALIQECIALNEGFDPTDDPTFVSLKNDAAFRQLAVQVRRRYPPVHRARVAFTLAQEDLFPEGLAADSTRRLFYMSNVHLRKLAQITTSGEVTDFVLPNLYNLGRTFGVHVDPADHSVWCATYPGGKTQSEIVHFDEHGRLLERYMAPGTEPHALNDLVLGETREIYVTDTWGNRVYRFDQTTHVFEEVKLLRPIFLPNGITISDDGNAVYFADLLGVIRLDLKTHQSEDVVPAPHDTLAGIDGLYWYRGSLVGVQFGTGANRVMRWSLTRGGKRIASSEVLERGTDLVIDPTTGVILDKQFYFIADSAIDNLDRDGEIVDMTRRRGPLHIAVLSLK